MAATGFTPISLYYSATLSAVPSAGNLVAGELALNTYDGKLYFKNSVGVVTLLAGSTSGPAGGSTTQVQYNNAGVLAGITGATSNGTALTLVAPDLGSPSSVGTMPAFTLGGTVSGGGNQINNVVIGTTTPLAGAFTTLSATGNTTVGFTGGTAVLTGVATSNGFISHFMQNDSTGNAAVTRFMLGNNTSTGAAQFVVYGGNHATLPNVVDLNNANNAALRLLANNAVVAQVNPTGLAVTGTLSSTGILAVAANAVSTIGGFSGTDAPTSMNLRLNRGATQFNGIAFAGAVTYDRGIYLRPSSDTLHIGRSAGGVFTDQLSVDGSGNVTVTGTLSGGTSGTGYSFSGSAPATSLTLDSSGRLGIETTTPVAKLHVSGTSTTAEIRVQSSSTVPAVSFYSDSASAATRNWAIAGSFNAFGDLAFQQSNALGGNPLTAGTTRMMLDASGNLLVGTTSASVSSTPGVVIRGASTTQGFLLNNDTTDSGISLALFYSSYSTANETKFEVTSEGNVKSRTNSYAGFSDARLKQGITPASTQWDDIKNIEVVKFQMKSEQFSDAENPWMLGVIAQQVEQVSPGLVDEDVKDGMKTVKYSILYMKAVKALQEAMTRIEQLEARLDAANI